MCCYTNTAPKKPCRFGARSLADCAGPVAEYGQIQSPSPDAYPKASAIELEKATRRRRKVWEGTWTSPKKVQAKERCWIALPPRV